LKAVTLRTPWAWAICHAAKDIENRVWKTTPNQLAVGERFAIHAGKLAPLPEIRDAFGWMIERGLVTQERVPSLADLKRESSAIVAIATFGGAVKAHPSRWFAGPFGWVLKDLKVLRDPLPCGGAQGLWNSDDINEGQIS
jgi:hypothetical protein